MAVPTAGSAWDSRQSVHSSAPWDCLAPKGHSANAGCRRHAQHSWLGKRAASRGRSPPPGSPTAASLPALSVPSSVPCARPAATPGGPRPRPAAHPGRALPSHTASRCLLRFTQPALALTLISARPLPSTAQHLGHPGVCQPTDGTHTQQASPPHGLSAGEGTGSDRGTGWPHLSWHSHDNGLTLALMQFIEPGEGGREGGAVHGTPTSPGSLYSPPSPAKAGPSPRGLLRSLL